MASERKRIGVFGWGVVAPKSPDVDAFARNLASSDSWLTPFNGFGIDNFLVGDPEFDLDSYSEWVTDRFPPNRLRQLRTKMGFPAQYAIGAFIQSLRQNPGIEQFLQELGTRAHVYVGTGLGDLPTIHDASLDLREATLEWFDFWCDPERNSVLRAHLESGEDPGGPADPSTVSGLARRRAEEEWLSHWGPRSPELAQYLSELRDIEGRSVEGRVEFNIAAFLKQKQVDLRRLRNKWGAPIEPWNRVTANVLWNIHNTPASQISMLGKIVGMTFAPVAACSTFGYALRLAMSSIRHGEADAVVIGATDPPPHPLSVGTFNGARVIASDGNVSKPLTGLRGTHISGGAVIWIVGDHAKLTARGFRPLGMEPLGVGVNADADHIITPTPEGPTQAIRDALADAGIDASTVGTWDLHATATPGDCLEVETVRKLLADSVVMTARKGTFGHGMGASGGWELLAQYLSCENGTLYPTPLEDSELNDQIRGVHECFVKSESCALPKGAAGKLSMGVGGINACVISRPW